MLGKIKLYYRARSKNQNGTDYFPLEEQQLTYAEKVLAGEGSVKSPWQVEITFQNQAPTVWEGIIHIEMAVPKTEPKFFLPGFLYGRNRGEAPMRVPNEFPRLRPGEPDRPASSWWMVRSDRLSHPAALIYDSGEVYGFCTEPFFEIREGEKRQCIKPEKFYQYGGFSCNLAYDAESASVGYTLGYENAPWLFIQSHTVLERAEPADNCFELAPGESVTVILYFYGYEAQNEMGIHEAIQEVYRMYHMPPRKIGTVRRAVEDLSNAVSEDAYLPKEYCYSGFVREDPEGRFSYNKILSLSWTNGFCVAVPLLLAANKTDNGGMREQAIACMEHIMQNCMNPRSGLPYDACNDGVWSVRGWWFDGMHTGGHAAYLSGQFVYYLLKAYENEKQMRGCVHEDWVRYVQPILTRLNEEKNSEGEYPFVYSEANGAGIEYDSFGGTWCLAATAYYEHLTGDKSYLDGLRCSEAHYHRKYVAKAECYGTPLDTDKAVDSEGILAYVRACRYLHMITKEDVYLQHLKDGLAYEFTFKFCYNVPVKYAPLSEIGWSSCGGSITSVANPHIHPMSSTIVGELKYYVEQTKDPYVESRMKDTILWGCQTYNTYAGEYGYGRKGWMSERFCYSQGLLVEKYPDGTPASTWFALMPWAACSVLEGLVEELEEQENFEVYSYKQKNR